MGNKRIRTPHYIKGIGTGNVPEHHADDDLYKYDRKRKSFVRSREKERLAEYPTNPLNFYAGENGLPRPSTVESFTWQFSAFALLGAVVFLSALFLHLLADAAEKSNQPPRRKRRSPATSKPLRKKKTDEWNEDSEEDQLLSEVRTVNDNKPPSLYYPYQPRLQQYRHRKNTGAGAGATTSGSSQPPVNSGLQHRSNSTYLNQSGAAQTPTSGRSGRVVTAASKTANSDASSSPYAVLPGAYPPDDAALRPPAIPAHEQQSTLNAQRMTSDASSFTSTTEEAHLAEKKQEKEPESPVLPKPSPRRSPCVSLSVPAKDGKSHVLLSPGTDDYHQYTPTVRKKCLEIASSSLSDTPDKTPVAANRGRYFQKSLSDQSRQGEPKKATEDVPSKRRTRRSESASSASNTSTEPVPKLPTLPFMPGLEVPNLEPPPAPPKSINVDELHLYQMMETGNVCHWEARVAAESRMLHSQAFPGKEPNAADVIMQELSENGSEPDSLASDDPRKSIRHKRSDLTVSTDAAASLQGAVDFKELELVEVIGGGGFGQVWKAMWNGTPVAVKVLTGSAQSRNVPRAVLEEFAAEINLLRGMRHPNICLYMGACLDPPNRAIITELAANGSLWDALRLPLMPPFVACDGVSRDAWPLSLYQPDSRHGAPPSVASRLTPSVPPRNTWPWLLVKKVALGAARGMSYLHNGKPPILHRDLKSANILLDDSYTAKVCDFGLSRLKAHERSMTGNCGTVQWMAPEVLANQAYNEKADVYSYGIILWELLTGQCPYDGMTAIQCALSVLNHNKRPTIPSWCPPSLHALIRSCVKKEPDERPSFGEIILALDSMP